MSLPRGDLSVWALFEAAADRHSAREFLHVPIEACRGYSEQAIALSYAQVHERALAVAASFKAAGYGAGHRIALALDNRPDFFVFFLALNSLGATVVPINAAMTHQELRYVLDHADVALAVAHADHAAHLSPSLPAEVPLYTSGEIPGAPHGRASRSDEAALLYTSGTSGTPKACVLGNEYFSKIGELYLGLGGYCRFSGVDDRLATPLPVTHMNALAVSFMAMVMSGGCLIQLDRFHPSTWWRSLRASGATAFHYLGVMPAMLLKFPPSPTDDCSGSLRFGFGAGVDPRHHQAFEARFGVPLIEAWAMTETGAGAWITAYAEPRHVGQRCFGKPPAGLEVRLIDDEGKEVKSGSTGELLVRRQGDDPKKGFFSGYYQDDAATTAAWADGWFHTGDLVRQGPDGSLFFVDRSKNIVRRSGENIAAVEVESALQAHPDVIAAAVTPVPDDIRGEEVFAIVILRAGVDRDLETAIRLERHCLEALAYHKVPGYIVFRDGLPKTASEKLARARIKELGSRAVLDGEAFDLRPLKKRTSAVAAG
jgi:acyl-CoA synthetase (AMP-forming)/AMP-acid ligase II